MKMALLLFLLLGQNGSAPPHVPLAEAAPEFPVHVHVVATRYGSDTVRRYRSIQGEMRGGPGYLSPTGSYHGYGSGNVMGGAPRGFDFTFDCSAAFRENDQAGEFYQARWKKQDERLEILTQAIGADRGAVCELKVAMKAHPFPESGAAAVWSSAPLAYTDQWVDPDVAYTEPDPDYPVHLHVLKSFRRYNRNGFEGYGSANLVDGAPQGLDFTYICSHGFLFNTQQDEFFQGHWVKPGKRLEILMQRMGSDHVDRCEIDVTLRNAPYPSGVVAAQAVGSGPAFGRP